MTVAASQIQEVTADPGNDNGISGGGNGSMTAASSDVSVTDENMPVNIDLLINDSGLENSPVTLMITPAPSYSSVSGGLPDNTITYTLEPSNFGQDDYLHSIIDVDGILQWRWCQSTLTISTAIMSLSKFAAIWRYY